MCRFYHLHCFCFIQIKYGSFPWALKLNLRQMWVPCETMKYIYLFKSFVQSIESFIQLPGHSLNLQIHIHKVVTFLSLYLCLVNSGQLIHCSSISAPGDWMTVVAESAHWTWTNVESKTGNRSKKFSCGFLEKSRRVSIQFIYCQLSLQHWPEQAKAGSILPSLIFLTLKSGLSPFTKFQSKISGTWIIQIEVTKTAASCSSQYKVW